MKLKLNLKFLKNKKVFKKEGKNINADAYWRALLIFTFVLVVVSFVFGFFLYKDTVKEFNLTQENVLPKNEKIKKDRLDKLLEYFSVRESKSKDIIASPSPISDPSI